MPPAIPLYLETAHDTVLCLFQPSADVAAGAAVLICSPWGWDEVASYRSRRRWAEQLAAAGHPTLRFDLPATGDSGGLPADPAKLDSWVSSISTAAEWLRDEAGSPRVAVLGLGLGGLLAREAVNRGAPVDEMALWAAPAKGSSFVREARAFSRLQDGRPAEEDAPSPLPAGWLEVGGFVLSEELLASLKSLDPAPTRGLALRRVLTLDRDGVDSEGALRSRFKEIGIEVSAASGEGWGEMVAHPERTRLASATADRFSAWLRDAGTSDEDRVWRGMGEEAPASAASPDGLELRVDGHPVRESPLPVPLSFGDAYGVLAEPADGAATDLCAVFLNPGAVRHIGPNRLWVETGRRWAARGVRVLRLDLEGIGEASGDDSKRADVASFYVPEFVEQVRAALDYLQQRGLGERFLLAGLCSGGYWSFRAALDDPRVGTALLLNAGALTWHEDLLDQRQARKLDRVWQASWWGKLFHGELTLSRLWYFTRLLVGKVARRAGDRTRRLLTRASPDPPGSDIEADLDRMRGSGTALVLAFSEGEPLYLELEAKGILDRLEEWPNLELSRLPGSDHTLRSAAAQTAACGLLDRELKRALEREEPTGS